MPLRGICTHSFHSCLPPCGRSFSGLGPLPCKTLHRTVLLVGRACSGSIPFFRGQNKTAPCWMSFCFGAPERNRTSAHAFGGHCAIHCATGANQYCYIRLTVETNRPCNLHGLQGLLIIGTPRRNRTTNDGLGNHCYIRLTMEAYLTFT